MARQLLALTNLAFWAEAGPGPVPSALRARVAPLAAPLVPALTRGRPAASGIRLLSQLNAELPGQPSVGRGDAAPSRRSPRRRPAARPARRARAGGASGCTSCWPGPACTSCSTATRTGSRTCAPGRFVTVHRLTSVPGRGVTVVRPDGYIGFLGRTAEASQLAAWLARVSAGGLCR